MQQRYSRRPWRTLFLTAGLAAAFGSAQAQVQAPLKHWDRTIGGNNFDHFGALHPTADGGYILGGSSQSGVSGTKSQGNLGNTDYWVVKIDSTGTKVWDRTIGGSDGENFTCLTPTSDGGYLIGGFSNSPASANKSQSSRGGTDYWVVKLDAQGNQQWDRTYGGNDSEALRVVRQTMDGGYLLAGNSRSGISGEKSQAARGIDDYWVVKIDAVGNKQWDRTLGSSGGELLTGMVQTADGGYVLAGHATPGVGGEKSQPNYNTNNNVDIWVIKLDAGGNKVWDRTFGGDGYDVVQDLQLSYDGGLILGGWSSSGATGTKTTPNRGIDDAWVLKLDGQGNLQWQQSYGGSSSDQVYRLQPTADGGYILGGRSSSPTSSEKTAVYRGGLGGDYWLVKIDGAGQRQWDFGAGGTGDDMLWATWPAADGGYVMGGYSGSGAGGDKTQGNFGLSTYDFDWWIVKTKAPAGSPSTPPTVTPNTPNTPPTLRPEAPATTLVYPNPAHDYLTVQLPESAPHSGLQLTLLAPSGKAVLRKALGPAIDFSIPVQLEGQPSGLYLLRLEGPGGYRYTQRLRLE